MNIEKIDKVVLAFSGGLDTSIILRWLQDNYKCEVVTFTADIGQGVEVEEAREKAKSLGCEQIFVEDLSETFVKDYVFPMFRANTVYEGYYLLGTSIARPLIAKRQIEIATEVGAKYVSHGATGKGNDQIRFELGYYANDPHINVIAPWREWELNSRNSLLEYAKKNKIEVPMDKLDSPPYSMDANLLHTSYEGKILEDPSKSSDDSMYTRSVSPQEAPDKAQEVLIEFRNGDPIKVNNETLSPANLLKKLNKIGGANGIGRIDIVENRFIGMKSRGVYETPGGTILLVARRAIESLTLDKGAAHLKDEIMPKYAELIYNGFWFSPEREMLQSLIDKSQEFVNGKTLLKLYKGNIDILSRSSDYSLYSNEIATFESDEIYNQKDALGFIKLNALRLKLLKQRT
jgi:argininosuccinate synthase